MHHKLLMMYEKKPMENYRAPTLDNKSHWSLKDNSIVNETTPLKINNTAVQKVMNI